MNRTEDHLNGLTEIRDIMRRSATFMSLTGLSGVLAGLYGIAAFIVVVLTLDGIWLDQTVFIRIAEDQGNLQFRLTLIAIGALAAALLSATVLTVRKAVMNNLTIWDDTSRRFAVHLFVPLAAGGALILAMVFQGQYQFVIPGMLLFFGVALLSAARFVPFDMVWFAIGEIILGTISCFVIQAGLLLWLAGFGLLPMIYGTVMYLKYER